MPDSDQTAPPEPSALEAGEDRPRGTLVLMLIFLVLLVAFWGYAYVVMLQGR
jgi:hypothetical protein